METGTVIKYLVIAAVAAVATTFSFFTKFGTPLMRGLVMIGVGFALTYFLRGKNVGMLNYASYGLIVAGGLTLANQYVTPYFNKASVSG